MKKRLVEEHYSIFGKKLCGIFLLIIGIFIIAIPIFFEQHSISKVNKELSEFWKKADINESLYKKQKVKEEAKTETDKSKKGKKKVEEKSEGEDKELDKKSILIGNTYAIGVIAIPSIGIQYLIYEGTSDYNLSKGIGHYDTTALFGEKGNCVLAGHTGSYDGIFFNSLPDLKAGDKVFITNALKKTFQYSVIESFKTNPDDERIIQNPDQKGKKWLTLITCADGGTSRFVCRCELIE